MKISIYLMSAGKYENFEYISHISNNNTVDIRSALKKVDDKMRRM